MSTSFIEKDKFVVTAFEMIDKIHTENSRTKRVKNYLKVYNTFARTN